MKCTISVEEWSCYLDGELGEGRQRQLGLHLAECLECQAELESLRSLSGMMTELADREPPPWLRSRVMAGAQAACQPCSEYRDRLQLYLDRELALAERLQVEEHLAACLGCSTELGELRRTVELLRRVPSVEPPARVWQAVAAKVAPAPKPVFRRLQPAWGWAGFAGVLVAAAAVALILPRPIAPTVQTRPASRPYASAARPVSPAAASSAPKPAVTQAPAAAGRTRTAWAAAVRRSHSYQRAGLAASLLPAVLTPASASGLVVKPVEPVTANPPAGGADELAPAAPADQPNPPGGAALDEKTEVVSAPAPPAAQTASAAAMTALPPVKLPAWTKRLELKLDRRSALQARKADTVPMVRLHY